MSIMLMIEMVEDQHLKMKAKIAEWEISDDWKSLLTSVTDFLANVAKIGLEALDKIIDFITDAIKNYPISTAFFCIGALLSLLADLVPFVGPLLSAIVFVATVAGTMWLLFLEANVKIQVGKHQLA